MIKTRGADGMKAGLPLIIIRKEVFYIGKANRADKSLRLRDEGIYAVNSD